MEQHATTTQPTQQQQPTRSPAVPETGVAEPRRDTQPGAALTTERGTTRIADSVVAKIAGLAARDIPGVHSMGSGMSRRVGQLKSMLPGGDGSTAGQGVAVQVGEREAAIDLDLVTWYGASIVDIGDAVRRHVIGQVEGMTGLSVVEVNIQVDDIQVETDDQTTTQQSRLSRAGEGRDDSEPRVR